MGPDAVARRRNGTGLVVVQPPSSRPHRSDAVQFEVCKSALDILSKSLYELCILS
jgi:hypothetical protein